MLFFLQKWIHFLVAMTTDARTQLTFCEYPTVSAWSVSSPEGSLGDRGSTQIQAESWQQSHLETSQFVKFVYRGREFNRRWPGWAPRRRCPRCVLSASSGSRTPPGECCASSPGCRRWRGWPEAGRWPGSEPPGGCSSQRGRPEPAPRTEPPAASEWPRRRRCGSDRPACPLCCAGGSTPGGEKVILQCLNCHTQKRP